jgi:hypothetical protein
MQKRARFLLLSSVVLVALATACESQTGPDAPARQNGCIDTDCYDAGKDATKDDQ